MILEYFYQIEFYGDFDGSFHKSSKKIPPTSNETVLRRSPSAPELGLPNGSARGKGTLLLDDRL